MDCSKCESWNNGRGKPACINCKQYKEIQIKSARRVSIKTEHIPDAIIENIADPRIRDLFTIIRQIPLQFSIPMMMRTMLNMSLAEIAINQNMSRAGVQKNIVKCIKIITQSLRDG